MFIVDKIKQGPPKPATNWASFSQATLFIGVLIAILAVSIK